MRHVALAIHSVGGDQYPPVVYELTADSIEIGAAEDNHIVFHGPGVEPFHLAIRWMESGLYLLVKASTMQCTGMGLHDDDVQYCAVHGKIDHPTSEFRCLYCRSATQPIWILRQLQAGDTFPIGDAFEATIVHQGQPNQTAEDPADQAALSWPDTRWLENPPAQQADQPPHGEAQAELRSFPLADSNLWVWNPPVSPFPVFMHQRVNRWVTYHAVRNDNREVGGLLLGDTYRDPDTGVIYPVITHAIPARFAREERGQLTFTRETWLALHHKHQEQHPERQILGWYHTHPGLDIFLSDWDLFIHRHFFNLPWQVALVVDPARNQAGFFIWADGEVLDPMMPHQLFKLADLDPDPALERQSRVRIKLGEVVQ